MDNETALALHDRQLRALEALVAGANVTQAATVAGVTRETVSRWVNAEDGEFRRALAVMRVERWKQAEDSIRAMLPDALHAIRGALRSKNVTTRLRAASLLLRHVGIGDGRMEPDAPPAPRLRATPVEATTPGTLDEFLDELRAGMDDAP